jgi:hypothetical protein
MSLPDTILAEVKFTTGESFHFPWREREALLSNSEEIVGLLASLFWCGDSHVDGRWLIVDVNEGFRTRGKRSFNVSKREMSMLNSNQAWLDTLRKSLEIYWPPLLQAFLADALEGQRPLKKKLDQFHEQSKLSKALPTEPVLEIDHQEAIRSVIEIHSEAGAGQIFQILFAYLLGLAGYRRVTLNAVGVPDITVGECITEN